MFTSTPLMFSSNGNSIFATTCIVGSASSPSSTSTSLEIWLSFHLGRCSKHAGEAGASGVVVGTGAAGEVGALTSPISWTALRTPSNSGSSRMARKLSCALSGRAWSSASDRESAWAHSSSIAGSGSSGPPEPSGLAPLMSLSTLLAWLSLSLGPWASPSGTSLGVQMVFSCFLGSAGSGSFCPGTRPSFTQISRMGANISLVRMPFMASLSLCVLMASTSSSVICIAWAQARIPSGSSPISAANSCSFRSTASSASNVD
mmetsp:Transcript_48755/g.86789  ORF Transcript_48755/g.86789 Transcript_48755/m.86789 type:complete len:260 (-) Transcript_48755:1211-1990(-)